MTNNKFFMLTVLSLGFIGGMPLHLVADNTPVDANGYMTFTRAPYDPSQYAMKGCFYDDAVLSNAPVQSIYATVTSPDSSRVTGFRFALGSSNQSAATTGSGYRFAIGSGNGHLFAHGTLDRADGDWNWVNDVIPGGGTNELTNATSIRLVLVLTRNDSNIEVAIYTKDASMPATTPLTLVGKITTGEPVGGFAQWKYFAFASESRTLAFTKMGICDGDISH